MTSRPAMENVPPPAKPRHHHRPSVDEGYSTSPEASTSSRRPSNASRAPQAQPMKGILKHVETPIVHIAHIQTDGYTSSPEKNVTSRYVPSRGQRSRLPSQPPPVSPPSITPPVSLHWSLLPYDHHVSKSRLVFDARIPIRNISFLNTWPPRPLTTVEREKPAANPPLTEMVICCKAAPEWPVNISRPTGIRCIDVWEAIRETFDLVVTSAERNKWASRVQSGQPAFRERCRITHAPQTESMRRVDLLCGNVMFFGLEWTPPNEKYPEGSWLMRMGPPLVEPQKVTL